MCGGGNTCRPLLALPGSALYPQPMEVYIDDETKLTLHGLQQYYVKLQDKEKNRKLFELLDALEFNQVYVHSLKNVFARLVSGLY